MSLAADETVSAWLTAPEIGPIIEAHPCEESPGKPTFTLEVDSDDTGA